MEVGREVESLLGPLVGRGLSEGWLDEGPWERLLIDLERSNRGVS